jgi:CheY-like chemotaxis protein
LAAASLRVAVIDDEPDAVLMMLTLLRSEGYTATGFGSARSALRELRTFDPDVVISDVSMPFMNGWELAREVRNMMGERPTLIGIRGQYMRGPDKVLAWLLSVNVISAAGGDPRVILDDAGACACVGFTPGLAWSPDGTRIAIAVPGPGESSTDIPAGGLYVMNADGSDVALVMEGIAPPFAWQPRPE